MAVKGFLSDSAGTQHCTVAELLEISRQPENLYQAYKSVCMHVLYVPGLQVSVHARTVCTRPTSQCACTYCMYQAYKSVCMHVLYVPGLQVSVHARTVCTRPTSQCACTYCMYQAYKSVCMHVLYVCMCTSVMMLAVIFIVI